MRCLTLVMLAAVLTTGAVPGAVADGGALRIDHKLSLDNDGVWATRSHRAVLVAAAATTIGTALWQGGETRLGKTAWQAIDASAMGVVSSEALKRVFTRERPANTDDPDRWFKGHSNHSFPSGEVTVMAALVTPFVLEYRNDHPAVYALELLPLYEAIARVKVQAHWQSDVLAGFALGTAAGYFAHSFQQPFFLSVLPHGFSVGLRSAF